MFFLYKTVPKIKYLGIVNMIVGVFIVVILRYFGIVFSIAPHE